MRSALDSGGFKGAEPMPKKPEKLHVFANSPKLGDMLREWAASTALACGLPDGRYAEAQRYLADLEDTGAGATLPASPARLSPVRNDSAPITPASVSAVFSLSSSFKM